VSGRNGHGLKWLCCGAFYRPEEVGRRGVRGERRSALSGHHSRLWFRSRVLERW
jgi:hypothetical protein